MCIIIVSPVGSPLPKYEILENCFNNNPDGAGYMYNTKDGIVIDKGWFIFEEFMEGIKELKKKIKVRKHNIVLHFRFATHGKTDSETCHPYPISDSDEDLKSLYISDGDWGLAHNGVISWCDDKSDSDLSDTQVFIKEYLANYDRELLRDKSFQRMMIQATGSKFAILTNDIVYIIGDFTKEKNGIYYSNTGYTTYKTYVRGKTTTYDTNDSYWEKWDDKKDRELANEYADDDDVADEVDEDEYQSIDCPNCDSRNGWVHPSTNEWGCLECNVEGKTDSQGVPETYFTLPEPDCPLCESNKEIWTTTVNWGCRTCKVEGDILTTGELRVFDIYKNVKAPKDNEPDDDGETDVTPVIDTTNCWSCGTNLRGKVRYMSRYSEERRYCENCYKAFETLPIVDKTLSDMVTGTVTNNTTTTMKAPKPVAKPVASDELKKNLARIQVENRCIDVASKNKKLSEEELGKILDMVRKNEPVEGYEFKETVAEQNKREVDAILDKFGMVSVDSSGLPVIKAKPVEKKDTSIDEEVAKKHKKIQEVYNKIIERHNPPKKPTPYLDENREAIEKLFADESKRAEKNAKLIKEKKENNLAKTVKEINKTIANIKDKEGKKNLAEKVGKELERIEKTKRERANLLAELKDREAREKEIEKSREAWREALEDKLKDGEVLDKTGSVKEIEKRKELKKNRRKRRANKKRKDIEKRALKHANDIDAIIEKNQAENKRETEILSRQLLDIKAEMHVKSEKRWKEINDRMEKIKPKNVTNEMEKELANIREKKKILADKMNEKNILHKKKKPRRVA
jgi:predicted glutamine amidotransferase